MENADSKDEYKGSYRNRHFPISQSPSVEVYFIEDDKDMFYSGELQDDDTMKKFVGNAESSI